ncbi:DUF2799 domain-containing protein [uncultured Algimonas sp.]|uniref:DUF2799 domain-containing protein n=1 Tax=uncultured Algimonas sp. TaxID=1547920 RepID=UPI002622144F|nr:DUF2799 domain-containing protein [uncultured Algimonas sp.]
MRHDIAKLGLCAAMAALSGCASISEDACRAGNWEDIGFKDGEAGRSRSRLADIGERCAEFGVTPDRLAYIRGLEMGLRRYCGPSAGYSDGRSGERPNAECEAGGYHDYLVAHADGYDVYRVMQTRDELVSDWRARRKAWLNVTDRLDEADGLSAKEVRRLERKAIRLERQMDDLRVEIRVLEELNGLPRWTP